MVYVGDDEVLTAVLSALDVLRGKQRLNGRRPDFLDQLVIELYGPPPSTSVASADLASILTSFASSSPQTVEAMSSGAVSTSATPAEPSARPVARKLLKSIDGAAARAAARRKERRARAAAAARKVAGKAAARKQAANEAAEKLAAAERLVAEATAKAAALKAEAQSKAAAEKAAKLFKGKQGPERVHKARPTMPKKHESVLGQSRIDRARRSPVLVAKTHTPRDNSMRPTLHMQHAVLKEHAKLLMGLRPTTPARPPTTNGRQSRARPTLAAHKLKAMHKRMSDLGIGPTASIAPTIRIRRPLIRTLPPTPPNRPRSTLMRPTLAAKLLEALRQRERPTPVVGSQLPKGHGRVSLARPTMPIPPTHPNHLHHASVTTRTAAKSIGRGKGRPVIPAGPKSKTAAERKVIVAQAKAKAKRTRQGGVRQETVNSKTDEFRTATLPRGDVAQASTTSNVLSKSPVEVETTLGGLGSNNKNNNYNNRNNNINNAVTRPTEPPSPGNNAVLTSLDLASQGFFSARTLGGSRVTVLTAAQRQMVDNAYFQKYPARKLRKQAGGPAPTRDQARVETEQYRAVQESLFPSAPAIATTILSEQRSPPLTESDGSSNGVPAAINSVAATTSTTPTLLRTTHASSFGRTVTSDTSHQSLPDALASGANVCQNTKKYYVRLKYLRVDPATSQVSAQPVSIPVPGCGMWCPLAVFVRFYADLLPHDLVKVRDRRVCVCVCIHILYVPFA
jgi:hypothetical protein